MAVPVCTLAYGLAGGMAEAKLDTTQKAQAINFDRNKYGTFAEIGAGQRRADQLHAKDERIIHRVVAGIGSDSGRRWTAAGDACRGQDQPVPHRHDQ